MDNGVSSFDGSDYRQIIKIQQGVINYIRAFFTDEAMMLRLFDKGLHDMLFNDAFNRIRLLKAGGQVVQELNELETKALRGLERRLVDASQFVKKEDVLIRHKRIQTLADMRNKDTPMIAKKAINLKAAVTASQLVW